MRLYDYEVVRSVRLYGSKVIRFSGSGFAACLKFNQKLVFLAFVLHLA